MATMLSPTRRTRMLIACAAAGGLLVAAVPAGAHGTVHPNAPTTATSHAAAAHTLRPVGRRPVTAGSDYLALGDSVPFGYRESSNEPTPDYSKATNFTGYPEYVGRALGLKTANASCPGETSGSFLDTSAKSNGCENSNGAAGGYRSVFPLHVSYTGSQLAYALSYLSKHHRTRLVSLMIGANDGFLCQKTSGDGCASELSATLKTVAKNVSTILGKIRNEARYKGQVVIVNYYSLDYTSQLQDYSTQQLNSAVDGAAQNYHVRIADGYGAFEAAAAQAGGETCTAGLLTTLSGGGCGVHPSVAGQQVLAQAVESAIRK